MNLDRELAVAKVLALKAGHEIMQIYSREFEVEYKVDNSPLTEADKKSNEVIVPVLQSQFPEYAVLSEESKDDKKRLQNSWCWIIDPLDGTKEFLKKNGEFTVNIALTFNNKVVLGVIYAPVLDELYYAVSEGGAYLEKNGHIKKLETSIESRDIRLVASRSHMSEQLKLLVKMNDIKEIKSIGSSLKGCLIAKAEADIYYRFGYTMEWDTAAMQCIIEESGGIFRQMDDSEMLYNRDNSLNHKGFYILNKADNKLNVSRFM